MTLASPAVWQPVAAEAIGREPSTARGHVSSEVPSLFAPSAPLTRSPQVLTIGHRAAEPAATAAPAPATVDLARLTELNGLVQALYRALTEPREAGATGPLLALSPAPMTGGPVSSAATPVEMAAAASPGGSGPDYVDPTGQSIAAIERRLDQQIRQNRSPPEIAETRFTLAQAIWNSSDAEETQTRALTLARQSKAALDAVADRDTDMSVLELREAVNDWISGARRPDRKAARQPRRDEQGPAQALASGHQPGGRPKPASDVSRSTATRSETDGRPSSRPARSSHLVVALTCDRPLEPPRAVDLTGAAEVWLGRAPPEAPAGVVRLSFTDDRMSALPCPAAEGPGPLGGRGCGEQERVRVQDTPQRRAVLTPGTPSSAGRPSWSSTSTPPTIRRPRSRPAPPTSAASFHPDLLAAWSALARVAPTRVPVMLQGETGTGGARRPGAPRLVRTHGTVRGGELRRSPRAAGGERAVRRAAGRVHGRDRGPAGLLRASSGGTLLLDEVGELPVTLQVKLLRVLQENEVQPVGAAQPVRVDLRVVTATHRDLAALVEEGTSGETSSRVSPGSRWSSASLRTARRIWPPHPTLLRRAGAPADVRFSRGGPGALPARAGRTTSLSSRRRLLSQWRSPERDESSYAPPRSCALRPSRGRTHWRPRRSSVSRRTSPAERSSLAAPARTGT